MVVRGRELAVSRTAEGHVFVTTDVCPHGHCSLANGGTLRDDTLVCPCHGSAFDLRTGTVLSPPAVYPLQVYPARIADGYVVADL